MKDVRLISFLPSATERVCALGLEEQLFGVTHECDFPPVVRSKPVVVRSALALEKMSMREIDVAVSKCIGSGGSLYEVDEHLLEQLAPTNILTQPLCQVCAPSGNEITRALKTLPSKPEVIWLTPHSLEEIFDNLRELGEVADRSDEADKIVRSGRARIQRTAELVRHEPRPRILCLEWTDPYYCCGHWVPEMIEIAGGEGALGRKGADSVRISWSEIASWSPEVLIVSPCGFDTGRAIELTRQLLKQLGRHRNPRGSPRQRLCRGCKRLLRSPRPACRGWRRIARTSFPSRSLPLAWTGRRLFSRSNKGHLG
jgi:iron complex transport system substrate-binding protein